MGIDKFIKKVCVQTAVYWGSPVDDGYGGRTFADPVEIACRWTDKLRLIGGNEKELVTKGEVLVTQDLDLQGYLYLGTLEDVEVLQDSSGDVISPLDVEGAYIIMAFDKIPMIKSTTIFVRTVFLGFGNV